METEYDSNFQNYMRMILGNTAASILLEELESQLLHKILDLYSNLKIFWGIGGTDHVGNANS